MSDAVPLYRRALNDRERVQGARHPDTLTTRQKLADAYLADGRIKDATSNYKKVLADRERVLGPDHLDTIAARGNLGSAYHSAGKMASAVQLYEQTCEGYRRVLGPDHTDTLARSANLASAYYSVGRLTDALSLLRDTMSRCERVLPPGDPLTVAVRESLTNLVGADLSGLRRGPGPGRVGRSGPEALVPQATVCDAPPAPWVTLIMAGAASPTTCHAQRARDRMICPVWARVSRERWSGGPA